MTKKNRNNLAYINEYQKEHYIQYRFVCRRDGEEDIIEKLNSVPQKATYIKNLIKQDIERQKAGGNV